MPKVGSKTFKYDKAGEKAAETYAKKTGQKVTITKPMKKTSSKGKK